MKIVGEKLETWAQSQSNIHDKDLFVRSAFNRYYYAAFLITREMLGEFDAKWKHTPHRGIPELLEKALKPPVMHQLKKGVRNNIIGDGEMKRLQQNLQIATSELAKMLRQAYDLRIITDYEPETAIVVDENVLLLMSYKLSSARSWADQASKYCKIIRRVWKDAGLD